MTRTGTVKRSWLAATLCICALAAPLAAGAQASAPPEWQPPTPAEGATFTVRPDATITIQLAAASTDPAVSIHIGSASLPPGATLTQADGNPATAVFEWTPWPSQAGDYTVTFVASSPVPTLVPVTRTVVIRVTPDAAPEKPVKLSGVGNVSRAAYVLRTVPARAKPSSSARVVGRVTTTTEELQRNMVLALESIHDSKGALWVRVRLPVLPNNSTGWIPRSAIAPFRVLTTRLVIDRGFFMATLFRDGQNVFRARVGVGTPGWPTPRGEFYVREVLTNFGQPFYGPVAFGTSGKSPVPTGYFAGAFIGIHGTSLPGLIPGRISHGCIRLRNPDVLRLLRTMPLGTPVTIR